MKKRIFALVLCVVLAMSTLLTGCGKKGPQGGADGTVYTQLYSSEVATLNYLITSLQNEQSVGANCIDTLVEYDNKGQLKEGLATKWEYDADTLTWTFTLREAKWVDHTGAEVADVTAQDFVDAMKYQLTPEYESSNAQNLFGVIANAKEYFNGLAYNGGADEDGVVWEAIDFAEVGVKAIDEHTLQYTLAKEVPYFLSSLVYVVYMPAYGPQLEELGASFGTSAETMYYNGAYYLSEFEPQVKHVLKKNPSNYDAANVFIDTVENIYNAEAITIGPEMVKRGEIDNTEISADLLDDWLSNEETKNIVSRERPRTNYSYFYCFNFDPHFEAEYEPENWKKAVNNENFRQAMMAGIDKVKAAAVVEPVSPESFILNTVTPFDFAFNADGKDYTTYGELANRADTFNKEKALEFKEKAMTELKAEGASFPVKVLMKYNPSTTSWDKECQVVEQQMEALLGTDFIDIIVEAGPTDNFISEVRRSGNYAFMKCNWGADYADPETWIDPFYQSKGEEGYDLGYKYAFLANAVEENTASAKTVEEYFALVDAAKAIIVDTEARFEAFAKAEDYLLDHALVVPYSITVSQYIATKLDVFEGQYAPFGVSILRYKGQHLQENYVSMDEFQQRAAK